MAWRSGRDWPICKGARGAHWPRGGGRQPILQGAAALLATAGDAIKDEQGGRGGKCFYHYDGLHSPPFIFQQLRFLKAPVRFLSGSQRVVGAY